MIQKERGAGTPLAFPPGMVTPIPLLCPRPIGRWARLRAVARTASEALFPRHCAGCDAALPRSDRPLVAFCEVCVTALRPIRDGACRRCGAVDDDAPRRATGAPLCRTCRVSPPPYARARGFWAYGGPLRDAILTWKNKPALHLAAPLGDLFVLGVRAHFGRALPTPDRIVPVPPTPARLRARGFNPPALLAARFAAELRDRGVRTHLAPGALRFSSSVPAMPRDAPRSLRLRRAAGVFEADPRHVEGKSVWLVDDVMTTGATAHGAALALIEAGATRVEVGVLSRVLGARVPIPQPLGSSSHEKAARSAWTPSSFKKSQSF